MRMTNKDIKNILETKPLSNINFGLYFKKFIELNERDNYKKYIDIQADEKKQIPKVDGHEVKLKNLFSNINLNFTNEKLKLKNSMLDSYIKQLENNFNFKIFEKNFKLKNKMIVGIGETTAGEVGMIFDYTTGMPYIPASSIKGVVRNIYLKNFVKKLLNDNNLQKKFGKKDNFEIDKIEENAEETKIYLIFGGDKKTFNIEKNIWDTEETYMGSVIFFDAYPIEKPKLGIDIINVHYQDYYRDGEKAPKDNMNPSIIKFLTVSGGTEFKFRYAINLNNIKEQSIIKDFEESFIEALTDHGIGAKTNLGYGIFNI